MTDNLRQQNSIRDLAGSRSSAFRPGRYGSISMKIHKTPRHKMRFISSACRFIMSSIVLVAVTVIAVTNYTFSRQNRQYNVNYNLSAATGLAKLLENQEDSFMQCINNAYVTYYSYREGIFSFFNASNRNSYAYRQNIYRFLSESFSLNSQIASMTIYSAVDQQIYSVTKSSSFHFQELLPEFQPLADSYGSPYTRLVICPSRSGELLGTAGSYSFVYCLRDVVTRENIGAIQADFSSAELERFLSSNYPGVMGDFLVLDPLLAPFTEAARQTGREALVRELFLRLSLEPDNAFLRFLTPLSLACQLTMSFVLLLCTVMNLTPAGSRKKYMKLRRPLVKSRKL